MKKTISILCTAGILLACSKESNTEKKIEEKQEPIVSTEKIIKLEEYKPEQLASRMAEKQNDTIYVTNFFATWCPPCVREIPHFKEKMDEMKNQPIKFTFVSLDSPSDWENKVKDFGKEYQISEQIILLNGELLSPDFFTKNFKTWDGGSIPFTLIRKGNKSDETIGGISKEQLSEKINALK